MKVNDFNEEESSIPWEVTFMDLSWPLKIVAIVVWAFIINFVISTILYFI